MFYVSLRLLRAITVLRCLLMSSWRHFGSNLALWVLMGTLGVSLGTLFDTLFGTLFCLLGFSWPLLGLSCASFGPP